MSIELRELLASPRPRYSICTLVTKPDQYAAMQASFRAGGFTEPSSEFIFADNTSGNRFDAYSGYNAFLTEARGAHIIICHQDVLLLREGREALDLRLAELTAIDPLWGVCGNAGRLPTGEVVVRITDPYGDDQRRGGSLPAPVVGLDENFIIVRRAANLGVPPRLSGFHLTAAALCLAAADLGLESYAIDFHLRHLSAGTIDHAYDAAMDDLIQFRSERSRPALVGGTISARVSASSPVLMRICDRLLHSRLRPLALRLISGRTP